MYSTTTKKVGNVGVTRFIRRSENRMICRRRQEREGILNGRSARQAVPSRTSTHSNASHQYFIAGIPHVNSRRFYDNVILTAVGRQRQRLQTRVVRKNVRLMNDDEKRFPASFSSFFYLFNDYLLYKCNLCNFQLYRIISQVKLI